jgi:hypothetical protein
MLLPRSKPLSSCSDRDADALRLPEDVVLRDSVSLAETDAGSVVEPDSVCGLETVGAIDADFVADAADTEPAREALLDRVPRLALTVTLADADGSCVRVRELLADTATDVDTVSSSDDDAVKDFVGDCDAVSRAESVGVGPVLDLDDDVVNVSVNVFVRVGGGVIVGDTEKVAPESVAERVRVAVIDAETATVVDADAESDAVNVGGGVTVTLRVREPVFVFDISSVRVTDCDNDHDRDWDAVSE